MSFGKFHESEGLAAIARAMRQKKEQQQEPEKADGDQEPESKGPKLTMDANEKKKEKKSKKRKGEAAEEVVEEQNDEGKKKDKKSKKRSEVSEDDQEAKPDKGDKKSKKDKERKREKAAVTPDSDEEDIVAEKPKKKKKKKEEAEDPEKVEDGSEEDGPILRLVKAIHSAEALQESLKNASELSNPSVAADTQDRLLAATSSTGARAVSLLLKTLQKSSEMRQRPSAKRAKGQVGGARLRSGAFETPEEALHTDLASAGNAGLHAQKLWSSVLQCNGESTAAARSALRGSAAAQDATTAGGDQRGPSDLDQQQCNTFGDFYRSSFVDAYAEDLEAMRQAASNERPVKAEVLLKCIQAGMGLFTEDVQKLMMANAAALPSSAANSDTDGAAGTAAAGHMTVHDILYGRI